MVGNVAQIIALISHGNRFLERREVDAFYPENSTFQHCESVDFRLVTKKRLFVGGLTSIVANTPNEWFEHLAVTECENLRFRYRNSSMESGTQDYNLAGMVGGGGEWSIEAVYGSASASWTCAWNVFDPDQPDGRIWQVHYATDGALHPESTAPVRWSDSVPRLRRALSDCTEFASKHGLEEWIPSFEKAANCLESESPEAGYYHRDLLADDISIEKRQLFYAAANAWVFGGMGSWNDNVFTSEILQRPFQTVTAELYDAVNEVFTTILNS